MAHFTTFLSSLSVQEERGAGRGRTLEDPSRVSAPPKTLATIRLQEERGGGREGKGRTLEDPSRISAPPKSLVTIRLQEERGGGEGKNPGRSLQGQSPPKNSTIIGQ